MELISPLDAMFLLGESREHPMHVAGLQVFEPPEGAGPDYIRDIYQDLVASDDVSRTFRKHPAELLGGIANLTWPSTAISTSNTTCAAQHYPRRAGYANCWN